MHIKRIVIQGFKTYKNTTIIDSFSPHHNVVVGRNGSGKSNFFAAIRFVLSDAYTNMTREERQSLIHEGSGTVMSAYVEIVFDNSDRRFPIDKDEIVIRRTIGMKKDDYSLDSKSATKSDIMNLLESAGFSKSNPYYIVPQGRITSLTNAKDSERLQLLKEVAGAKVFETKLKDSLKEMANTNKKREQIDEMLRYIESRLEDLDLEKNDLKEFEKLNNKKKALEYNLYDRELASLNEQIESIENDYASTVQDSNLLVQKLAEREKMVKKIDAALTELGSNKKLVDVDIAENDNEIREVLTTIGETTAQLKESEVDDAPSNEAILKQIQDLTAQISQKETELGKMNPSLKGLKAREFNLRSKLDNLKLQQRSMLSKKGRFSQFKTKKKRDAWLTYEIQQLQEAISAKKSELSTNLASKNDAEKERDDLTSKLNELGEYSHTAGSESLDRELSELKLEYNRLIDERKQLWREESKLNSVIQTYEQEKANAEQSVGETMDRSMALGLESVQKIAKNLGLNGVYGTLGELINVSDKYKTAIEVVGGSSLFHVVVDTDRTASLIMDELIRQKAGRVTFMPLNRLNPKATVYPEGNDSVALIKKLAYDEYLEPAIRQIFGKAVVCISLERGSEIARTHKLNAITLDGDRCDRKGVLTGGFRDQTRSRIDSLKNLTKWKSLIFNTKEKLETLKQDISDKDASITKVGELLASKRKELDARFSEKEALLSRKSKLHNERSRYEQEVISLDSRIEELKASIKLSEKQILDYENELGSDFNDSSLSQSEQSQLQSLSKDISKTETEYNTVAENLDNLELTSSSLTSELNGSLYPRLRQLNLKSNTTTEQVSESTNLFDLKRKLQDLEDLKTKLEDSNKTLHEKAKEISKEMLNNNEQMQSLNESQRAILKKLDNHAKISERSLSKKILLSSRKDEVSKKVRDLGVLPDEAFTSYKEITSVQLLTTLNRVAEKLKQYSHVNKKALEQFVNFTKQRDSLATRREELEQAKDSIESLISVLEKRKDDAIIQTFKEVSVGFAQVFEKLVPAGTGKLIIQRRSQRVGDGNEASKKGATAGLDDESDDEDEVDTDIVDQYVGISISVSFNSKEDEQQRIEQLSGGQKSLCAIALILAIQRCDPAPFYLFDEIDANLDTQYRTSVSQLINNLSKNAQFICTTFRPEMLKVCDKFFGVMFNNKVSTVSEINQSDALGFIEGQHRR